MVSKTWLGLCVSPCLLLLAGTNPPPAAQQGSSPILVNVVLVQLNVAVTDRKGNYISGLRPEDFVVSEDKIPQQIAWFEEGNKSGHWFGDAKQQDESSHPQPTGDGAQVSQEASAGVQPSVAQLSPFAGASVFILFDTSDYMYRGFVFAQDAIAGFVHSMEEASRIAFYSYSRDLSRATTLTSDRSRVLRAVRGTVAGDNAALYNCLLLTVRDAAPLQGRKAIVVFSNGPDNASSVPPEDVEELAQSTGTIIYIISTRQAESEPVSSAVFARMSKATGGKAYFAKNWQDEKLAFGSIREDLTHLYTLSYYPKPNPNRGWRKITVTLVGKDLQKYHVRTRDGYRLLEQSAISADPVAGQPVSDPR
jgi:Ca-activated chloride channel homolog